MQRSEINRYIKEAIDLFKNAGFHLPPFAFWTPEQWRNKGPEADEIRDNGLGWDLTDYGLGSYLDTGLLLFTLRNGNYAQKEKYPKGYAEKIMVVKENQVCPWHFHWHKREDIINRGGGELVIELYLCDDKENLSDQPVSAAIDGQRIQVAPGGRVVLAPGQSICLEPYMYHKFYGNPGKGTVIVGEVSAVNDDHHDNRFLEQMGRFPDIVEDELPIHLLCTEYPKGKKA